MVAVSGPRSRGYEPTRDNAARRTPYLMAASVRIEDEAFSDLRYEVLAQVCHLADASHALGKMALLWRQCTQQQRHVLDASIVIAVLGPDGVAGLEKSRLGEAIDGGVRIRGTKGRIEWLGKLRKNARKGGLAKAAKRQTRGSVKAANSLPSLCPPAPAPADQEHDLAARPRRAPSGDHQTFIARFTDLFSAKNLGTPPDWKPKAKHGMVKTLIEKPGGLQEALRRAENMFGAPPPFPGPPYELETLVRYWDRFAQPYRRATNVGHYQHTGDEEYAGGEVDF